MQKHAIIITFILLVILLSCSTRTKHPLSCNENAGADKLLVFIGEKIAVKGMKDGEDNIHSKYQATYKIKEIVCGSYEEEKIAFTVYEHYSIPDFAKHETIMFYFTQDSQGYHFEYIYHPLYKTKDGRWAGPVEGIIYGHSFDTTNPSLQPVKIDFANEVYFSTAGLKKRDVKMLYPQPFYKIEPGKAIPEYGNYVPELFMQSKMGMLTNRGFFGDGDDDEVVIRDVIVQEIVEPIDIKISAKERKALEATWKDFITAISANDAEKIKEMSLDSVTCSVCEGFTSPNFYNDKEPIDTFLSSTQVYFPGSNIWEEMKAGKYELNVTKYPDRNPEEYGLAAGQPVILHVFRFNTTSKTDKYRIRTDHKFIFLKLDGKYVFYGMESKSNL